MIGRFLSNEGDLKIRPRSLCFLNNWGQLFPLPSIRRKDSLFFLHFLSPRSFFVKRSVKLARHWSEGMKKSHSALRLFRDRVQI
ncbi:MAG: hypothetical protein A2169_05595 [Deltaproteobacteria bacterium RBG_13_47_9]|nr:MAG: hypothetical protein A2169_05595 [Deltaproteobacteria bacterium RBG_13_47_9]